MKNCFFRLIARPFFLKKIKSNYFLLIFSKSISIDALIKKKPKTKSPSLAKKSDKKPSAKSDVKAKDKAKKKAKSKKKKSNAKIKQD